MDSAEIYLKNNRLSNASFFGFENKSSRNLNDNLNHPAIRNSEVFEFPCKNHDKNITNTDFNSRFSRISGYFFNTNNSFFLPFGKCKSKNDNDIEAINCKTIGNAIPVVHKFQSCSNSIVAASDTAVLKGYFSDAEDSEILNLENKSNIQQVQENFLERDTFKFSKFSRSKNSTNRSFIIHNDRTSKFQLPFFMGNYRLSGMSEMFNLAKYFGKEYPSGNVDTGNFGTLNSSKTESSIGKIESNFASTELNVDDEFKIFTKESGSKMKF
ncbi:hypothetical protein HK099_008424 [Clydaea vesicula]|uniref:Uncharacterized protein n=1 Tax=Clydaea vesicula TaxID=447962 RepID=A0AAD5U4Z4_9FUNG|nr:hypothetical protein HK099_008424 [Clydaea vesicula]